MKKSISKTAALVMAAMMAGAAMPASMYAVPGLTVSAETSQNDKSMKEALATVKKRVTVPKELSEFTYDTYELYGTKAYRFHWSTPKEAEQYRSLDVSIVGDIITGYDSYNSTRYSNDPQFAKLTEEQLLEKAKGYLKQLSPSVVDRVKLEIGYLSLNSYNARINIQRYENGVKVKDSDGSITLNKDTGELMNFSLAWADGAKFESPAGAKSEAEIKEAYKKLCTLTPYYRISRDWETGKKTTRIVYQPDMTSEIDAFTGEASHIWNDMEAAEGMRLSYLMNATADASADAGIDFDEDAIDEEGEVTFTEAELKKIQQDENLLTNEQIFELLKKDKFVALTDDYIISSYGISSEKTPEMILDVKNGISTPNKEKETEKFYIGLNYKIKDELKTTYKGYKTINVRLDAETGELISMNKYNSDAELPKLNVPKAKAAAEDAAKTYGKAIFGEYVADQNNDKPTGVWSYTVGKETVTEYENSRTFRFNRYVNGIRVPDDYINVGMDSNGVVTSYNYHHTDDAAFPSADDMLTTDQAFEKLYQQQKFNYYYDGWVEKNGTIHTYLIYMMDNFYINAKTGRLSYWDGSPKSDRVSASEVKYTDIKGIPQEQAILTLQKYGVVLTTDSKFDPTKEAT
ncbi:MAG: hypothetical protein J1E40_11790, partial [Oscillospiraceae bacterium]|nr:hypothetical protein [Oscillospiraceae bacterium]